MSRPSAVLCVALFSALLFPTALADLQIEARLDSMRGVQVEAHGDLLPTDAPVWRGAIDGDASGSVSNEEVGVFISVVDGLIADASLGPLEAYNLTWARENASGAHKFTIEGRARLAQFALERSAPLRFGATFDGLNGTLDRVETTITNLTGRVTANATISLLEVAVFSWVLPDFSKDLHRLDLFLPPVVAVNLAVGGSIEIVSFENVLEGKIDSGRSSASGKTIEYPAVFYLRARPISDAAYLIAFAAILGPAVVVGIVALWSSPRHIVKDSPLPVEPRYK